MKGLHTNVLVRYLTRDDEQQWQRAEQYINATLAAEETCFISNIVLCELVWVLRSAYRIPREELITTLEKILRTSHFDFEDKAVIWGAFRQFQQGKADFSDYLISKVNHQAGCTETATWVHVTFLRGN
ncbi:PIN domain-containing protein [Leptodesmis sichuanensis]|uniref:PIN domain-containing protein n=1 Tax=Leptodesmis sichuanensis TaxID=2906798 RepID=UPI001F3F5ADD|nr:type II toxin-antitoxin system VapC family toxin [Leptodesmis sichuanensis]UIE37001.1 type II toxin-antitoxin system VapC family toxin [Leptodesmis sichuanensis A121]